LANLVQSGLVEMASDINAGREWRQSWRLITATADITSMEWWW